MPRGIKTDYSKLEHGDWRMYRVCVDGPNRRPCQPCKNGYAKRSRARHVEYARGVRFYVPVDRSLDHLRFLKKHGMGSTTIAGIVGTSANQIRRIINGRHKGINPELERRIMSITLEGNRLYIPAQANILRLHALMALGYTHEYINTFTGRKHSFSTKVKRTTRDRAQLVLDMCVKVGNEPGPSEKTRKWCAHRDYLPPAAYDAESFYDIEWDGDTRWMLLQVSA